MMLGGSSSHSVCAAQARCWSGLENTSHTSPRSPAESSPSLGKAIAKSPTPSAFKSPTGCAVDAKGEAEFGGLLLECCCTATKPWGRNTGWNGLGQALARCADEAWHESPNRLVGIEASVTETEEF